MRNYSSVASSKVLDTTINSSTNSMIVNNTTGFPATPFTLVIEPDTANEEIVLVTAVVGTTLTIQRGATTVDGVIAGDGTLGKAHDAGAVIKHMVTARDLQEPQNHIAASTNVHGLAGGAAVVGTTTTQTLENKTIGTGSSIASSVTAVTQSSTDDSTKIATTAFVQNVLGDTLTTLSNSSITATTNWSISVSSNVKKRNSVVSASIFATYSGSTITFNSTTGLPSGGSTGVVTSLPSGWLPATGGVWIGYGSGTSSIGTVNGQFGTDGSFSIVGGTPGATIVNGNTIRMSITYIVA